MAKKLVSINLDDDLISEIDKVSESIGMSRSAFVNVVMRATCMGETNAATSAIITAAIDVEKSKKPKKSKAAVAVD